MSMPPLAARNQLNSKLTASKINPASLHDFFQNRSRISIYKYQKEQEFVSECPVATRLWKSCASAVNAFYSSLVFAEFSLAPSQTIMENHASLDKRGTSQGSLT